MLNEKIMVKFKKLNGKKKIRMFKILNKIQKKNSLKFASYNIVIYQYLYKRYNCSIDMYNLKLINTLIYNKKTHILSILKDYLIFGKINEYLNCFYKINQSKKNINHFYDFYQDYFKFFNKANISDFKINKLLQNYYVLKINNVYQKYYQNDNKRNACYKNKNELKNKNNNDIIFSDSIKYEIENEINKTKISTIKENENNIIESNHSTIRELYKKIISKKIINKINNTIKYNLKEIIFPISNKNKIQFIKIYRNQKKKETNDSKSKSNKSNLFKTTNIHKYNKLAIRKRLYKINNITSYNEFTKDLSYITQNLSRNINFSFKNMNYSSISKPKKEIKLLSTQNLENIKHFFNPNNNNEMKTYLRSSYTPSRNSKMNIYMNKLSKSNSNFQKSSNTCSFNKQTLSNNKSKKKLSLVKSLVFDNKKNNLKRKNNKDRNLTLENPNINKIKNLLRYKKQSQTFKDNLYKKMFLNETININIKKNINILNKYQKKKNKLNEIKRINFKRFSEIKESLSHQHLSFFQNKKQLKK